MAKSEERVETPAEGRMRERITELEEYLEAAIQNAEHNAKDRDAWRDAHLPDPEAEALAGCVRAIEAMQKAHKNSRNDYGNFASSYTQYGSIEEEGPSALAAPEGRILLALAARYGLAIEAVVPKPRVIEGQRLVSMPADLAEQIERMHLPASTLR